MENSEMNGKSGINEGTTFIDLDALEMDKGVPSGSGSFG